MRPLLTIGHSRHPIEKFLELLRQHAVEELIDVRSHPFSRFSPHFSRKALDQALVTVSVRYVFMGDALGGRPKQPECYDEEGALDYSRVEKQPFYQEGIARLIDRTAHLRACVMCAEEDPFHCHRRLLISHTLVRRGFTVQHIRKDGTVEPEPMVLL